MYNRDHSYKNRRTSPVLENNYYKMFSSKLIRKKAFLFSVSILIFLFSLSLIVTIFTNKEELLEINFENAFIHPNKEYLFGTNEFGQNFFYQVSSGIVNTIKFAFFTSIINLTTGVLIGSIWGHYSKIDNFMIFIRNIVNNIPLPFFYIMIVASFGFGFLPMLLIVTVLGWLNIASLVRNNLILIRNKDYNRYSKLCRTSTFKIITNNYLPSLLPLVFNAFAISIPETISLEITLSYFGFSFGQTSISLGYLLHNSLTSNNWFSYSYLFLIPLFFIYILNLCFFYIGKCISEASIKEDDACLK